MLDIAIVVLLAFNAVVISLSLYESYKYFKDKDKEL